VKTTLDLPDELLRTVKVRAANEGRSLKDVVSELIRRGLVRGATETGDIASRVRLPLVQCAHSAIPTEEATPERVAALLVEEEQQRAQAPARRQ
jgi:plasmid stability protein